MAKDKNQNNKKKLSINVDMGAKNNGVFLASINDDKIAEKSAFNVKIDKGQGLVFDRANRLTKRHTRRSFDRNRFVLRFIGQVLPLDKLSRKQKEQVFGLFKNRGFNYQNIEVSDEAFDDENFISVLEKFEDLEKYGYEFGGCESIGDFENIINKKADELSNSDDFKAKVLEFFKEQSEIVNDIKELFAIPNDLKNKSEKLRAKLANLQEKYPEFAEISNDKNIKSSAIKSFVKFFNELIDSAKNELERNNKHRKVYLKDIKSEIYSDDFKEILQILAWDKEHFYNFVGNVANIQTRVWRRYFNFTDYNAANFDKDKMEIYDDSKLAKQISRNFRDFRYEKEHEKGISEKIKPIMQKLEKGEISALEFLKSTDPVLTIPPYESRINKNPQTCNTLSIKPEKITPNLMNTTRKIFANDEFSFLLIDENGEIKKYDFNEAKITAKYLQRFLDISKTRLNDSDLYPRDLIQDNAQNIEIFKRFFALNDDEIKEFVKFANAYYDEVNSAKKGVLKGEILQVCGLHTPHKHKNKHELISALFMKNHRQILAKEFDELNEFLQNSGEYKGKSKNARTRKIAKFFEDLDETRKSYQNAFFNEALNTLKALNEKSDKSLDDELVKIVQDYEIIAASIQEKVKFCEFKTPFIASNLATNLNYLLQLGDIIFSDKNAGFLKTCKEHTMENLLRSGGEAMASRLPSNAGRLINGKIEMYLDRLAYEIIKQSPKFDDFDEIEINVEMNKFDFEESVVGAGLKSKPKKKKDEKTLICPYSGENISEKDCEYDHIIARNDKSFNTVFNSAANLIPCKSSANLEKSNKVFRLENLHSKHLQSVFGTSDIATIKAYISENLATIKENEYTNFYNLSKKEQNAFRYALFLREGEDFKKAISLLNEDKIKGYSNGTQKRFVNLLIEKITKLSKKTLNFSANFIDSKMLSATRRKLASVRSQMQKQEIQDSHSHCIDASLVFHLVNSKLIKNSKSQMEFLYDYFDEIYLSQSEIIVPKSKQYLELKTNVVSKGLFDDSVYSLVYERYDNKGNFISVKNLEFLRDLGLLHTRQKGKKILLDKDKTINENELKRYFVSTSKVFDKIFEYFKNGDIKGLEKLKFLDNYLKSYIRKDVCGKDNKGIFFNKDSKLTEPSKKTPNVAKFYKILQKHQDEVNPKQDKNGKVVYQIKENAVKALYEQTFGKGEKRKRNKTRVTYSLPIFADSSECVVRRNGGYMGLKKGAIASKNYLFKNPKGEFSINSVPFYSKNVLPKKISDILAILTLPKDAVPVYDFADINLAKILSEIMPQNVAKHIVKLDFVISQADRHIIRLYLRKNSFDDINFAELKEFTLADNEFTKLYERYDNLFKSVLGTPRVEKPKNSEIKKLSSAKILQNDSEILGFEYTASNSANFKAMIKEIVNETPSPK